MATHELLNNITHKDVKINTQYSAEFGDNVSGVVIFPTEFGDVQKEYPIFFRKNSDTEAFHAVAMLGIAPDENLFLCEAETSNGWKADYVPAIASRGPFLIGFQDRSADGGDEKTPVVHIDMDNPRVSDDEGVPIFLEHGGNSPYLENINRILQGIYEGMAVSEVMIAAYTELDLLEPVSLEIELSNGEKHRLHGSFTISQEKLSALGGETLARLNTAGLLQGAFLVMASMSNVQKLVNMKNQRL